MSVVYVACVYAAKMLGCEGDDNAGVLSSAGDMLEVSVVRAVGGVCEMCMCLARGGVGGIGVSG